MELDGIPQIEAREAQRRVAEGALMVDVREPFEFTEARIPGALLVPMSQFGERWEELPRDRHLVIQCRSGNRSQTVARFLAANGLDVSNLAGGILAWHGDGLPVESGPVDA